MSAPPAQAPEQSSAGAAGKAADSQLLMDEFLPRYDFAVVHADVLRWFGPCSASGDCHKVWWAS